MQKKIEKEKFESTPKKYEEKWQLREQQLLKESSENSTTAEHLFIFLSFLSLSMRSEDKQLKSVISLTYSKQFQEI